MHSNTDSPATANHQRSSEIRRVVLSSYLGSTIEFYDFLLYATAASLVFGPVFFTGLDPLAATIASYGTFAAGYIARPLGGIVLGHFGDRLGRKRMLVLSMTIMGAASFLIGLVPPASAIGSWAAIILVALRVCQGVAVGGEWGGAALMSLEHASSRRRGLAASFTNAGAPSGAVLGTVLMSAFAALPREQFLAWGWRIPFLLSAALLAIGLFVRARISESPIFREAVRTNGPKRSVPIVDVLRNPKTLLLNMIGCSGSFAMQILFATFAITFAASSGADEQLVLLSFALASFLQVFTVIAFGRLSDVVGRRPVMLTGLASFALLLHPLFGWLASGHNGLVLVAFLVGLTCHAMTYGPMAAYISEQVGTTSRYTGASLGYQGATLLGAGLTPVVLASLHAAHPTPGPLVWFLIAVCAVSAAAVLATRESKDNDLQQV